jgi:hypothetical protein
VENRLSIEEQDVVNKYYPSAKIEKSELAHHGDWKAFRSDYQLDHHDLSFDIGKRMNAKAKAVRSKDEQRWVKVLGFLINELVEDSQNLEGRENLKPSQIIKGIKV